MTLLTAFVAGFVLTLLVGTAHGRALLKVSVALVVLVLAALGALSLTVLL